MDTVDAVVIGAGVVGLAVARALAIRGRETLILEACGQLGTGASSRNSEVVHAGIYYPRGSLKAQILTIITLLVIILGFFYSYRILSIMPRNSKIGIGWKSAPACAAISSAMAPPS